VQFPVAPFADGANLARVTMIERWDQREVAGAANLPFSGEPLALAEPLTISLTEDVTLIVKMFELGRYLGRVDWAVEGPGDPVARVVISATLFDVDGEAIGSYRAFPTLLDPAQRGVTEIPWREPFQTTQEGAVTVVLDYSVGLVEIAPSDVDHRSERCRRWALIRSS
jgi:hypothetical protein